MLRLFINGIVLGSAAVTTFYSSGVNPPIQIGNNGFSGSSTWNMQNFRGNIDELRVSKGVARYTANFTPPTAEFIS
jgi:hypothetical protein